MGPKQSGVGNVQEWEFDWGYDGGAHRLSQKKDEIVRNALLLHYSDYFLLQSIESLMCSHKFLITVIVLEQSALERGGKNENKARKK